MLCPKCKHLNAQTAAFCQQCGTRLELACGACKAQNRPGARFCANCGNALKNLGGSVGGPASHTPQHLIDRIIASKSTLLGERKEVTVLFADIVGSTQLIADRDPEEASAILDPALKIMMDGIHAYEGTIIQIAGDGLMALFGAPLAHEDHSVRAGLAAIKIQQDVRLLASRLRQQQGVDVQVRVGLNCGEVVFRSIQSDLSIEYTVVGKTVHLAARMEQLARPGTILITEAVRQQVLGLMNMKALGDVPIKGLSAPIAVYQLESARPDATRLEIAREQERLSRFVGRKTEFSTLQRALTRAIEGRGQMVGLVGEPGTGKSRLAYEVARSSDARMCLRLETHALSYGTRTAYLPLLIMLRSYFELDALLSAQVGSAAIREQLQRRVTALDIEVADVLPAIMWLLDIAEADEKWASLDPLVRRQRALDAIKRLFLAESQKQPLLLIFEDLQWIDSETQAVLDALVEIVPAASILMILTYRPEFEHSWGGRTFYRQIAVEPLVHDEFETLLNALVGRDPSLVPLKELVAQRTEGNPFFLEETILALVETRQLTGTRGNYRLRSPTGDIRIPRSVQAVLAARVDRLGPVEKQLLQAASVVGKDVPLDVLADMVGRSPEELENMLSSLQAGELVYQTSLAPKAYTFKHALTHEVAYGSLLSEQRRDLHAKAMHAIERTSRERLEEQIETLARHALLAEDWEKAVAYLRRAGLSAALRSTYSEAETWQRQALGALARLGETTARKELGIDLRLELYTAILAQGDHTPVFTVLEEARQLATAIASDNRLARIEGYLAHAYWWIAEYQTALERAELSIAISRKLKRTGLETLGLIALGWTHEAQGRFDDAKRALESALVIIDAMPVRGRVNTGEPLASVVVLAWLATCASEMGNFDEGERLADEAIRRAEEADHPWSRACAYHALGSLLANRGRVRDGIAVLERGQRLCTSQGVRAWAMTTAWALGHAYVLADDVVRGMSLLEDAARQATNDHCLSRQSVRVAWLAEAQFRLGHRAHAISLGQEALALSRRHIDPPAEAEVLRILGDFAGATGDYASQIAHYRQALSIAKAHGLRPLQARCHLAMALAPQSKADTGANDTAERAVSFAEAATLTEAMGMVKPRLVGIPSI